MNVDWFANNPKAKWYFVTAAVQLVLVLAVYIGAKYYMKRQRQRRHYAQDTRRLEEV